MPDVNFVSGRRRARWTVAALVVGAVAAGSLALGLLVVGPMVQQRLQTPPPALSVNGTTTATVARVGAPPPVVEIKERPIPRPKPQPVTPPGINLSTETTQTPPTDDPPSGVTEIPADPGQSEPSIHASISSTDDGKAGSAAPAETDGSPEPRKSHRNSRHTGDETSAASVQDGTDASPDPEMKSRVSGIPKARTHRLLPLEALPPLDSDGSAPSKEQDNSDGIDVSPATPAPAADHDPHKPGRSYRVQVGRYTDPAEAERVKADLAKAGMATQVVRSQKDGVTQYRVQVGTFKQRENADRQMDRLRALQYSPYIADEEP